MFNRIKQFYRAITARITFPEALYVREMLDINETILFFAMSVEDQKHSVNTAFTVQRMLENMTDDGKEGLDEHLLLKAALLHDVGRVKGDMKIYQKALCVLLDKWDPQYARNLSKRTDEKGSLSHALFVYYNHPKISASKIEKMGGAPKLVYLVRWHHSKRTVDENNVSKELSLLKKADGMN